jgi:Fur family transcriptional regulator, peroxide stress response regulator
VENRYKKYGLKLTPQRIEILRFLESAKTHPSAADIYEAVSKKFPTMSFATVYNTLHALEQKEGVCVLSIDPEKKRYDFDTATHHHLICVKCKKVMDVYRQFSLDLPEQMKQGFHVTGNHVDFYGICSKCNGKEG